MGDVSGASRAAAFSHDRPHSRVGSEGDGDKAAYVELRFRAVLLSGALPDTADPCSRLLDEVDAMKQVRNERISPNAHLSEIGRGQALGQAAGTDHVDAIRIDLDEDVGTLEEPVAVHDGVGDGFPHGLHRVLWDVLPPQALDSVRHASVALDEPHGLFDVRRDALVEILTVQDIDFVDSSPQ